MITRRLGIFAMAIVTFGALGLYGCNSVESDVGSDESAVRESDSRTKELEVAPDERDAVVQRIATKKATCPFVGAAIAMESMLKQAEKKVLKLLNTKEDPLAPIVGEGSIEALGNTGNVRIGDKPKASTLGYVLAGFALGNHGVIPSSNEKVPRNTFSLDFPGSIGSHPGHSFILQNDPKTIESGGFSQADFDRLIRPKPESLSCPKEADEQGVVDEKIGHSEVVDGARVVRRSEFAKFIAENVFRDPNAKALGKNNTLWRLTKDSIEIGKVLVDDLTDIVDKAEALREAKASNDVHVEFLEQHRALATKVTTLLGEDNLIGSAGEYALLLAFLENSPKTIDRDTNDPGYDVDELTLMFKGDEKGRRLPDGWDTWNKDALVWARHTTALLLGAAKHYHFGLKKKKCG